jgi:hypothetical protein
MKQLFIKRLVPVNDCNLAEAAHLLEKQTVTNHVDTINWSAFSYKPQVTFRIGHTGSEIWLKFYVAEKHIRALETRTNGDVYKDSCVEFFIAFDSDNYYNFEFSCIGTRHLSFGPGRGNRTRVAPEIVEQIKIEPTLGNQPFEAKSGNFNWEMMLRIPVTCFAFHTIQRLDNTMAKANFYKCGDETAEPHFVTWNPVKTEKPDYHRPEFFGPVQFE